MYGTNNRVNSPGAVDWDIGRGQKLVQERERDYRGTRRSVCVIYMRRRHWQPKGKGKRGMVSQEWETS